MLSVQNTAMLRDGVVESTSEGEDALHPDRRAKYQKRSNFPSRSGTLPELVVDLAQSLPEIPYIHCPTLKSESTCLGRRAWGGLM